MLNDEQVNTLVWVALGQYCLRRAHRKNGKFLRCLKAGYLKLQKEGKVYNSYELTQEGINAILALTDDHSRDWFPLKRDIAKAKQQVKEHLGAA